MSLPNGGSSGGISWFWGVVLSVAFHVLIFLLVMFWGFGSSKYSAQPNFIEGRLVSLSDLAETEGNKEIKAPQVKEELQKRPQSEEKKQVEEPKAASNKEKPKKVEQPTVEPKKAEKEKKPPPKAVKEEKKKEEPKKEEEQKKEEPKDKNVVALETKKEVKKAEKEPKPTKAPEVKKTQATKKKEKPDLENAKSRVLKNIQENVREEERRSVLEELQKEQGVTGEKVVAKANTTEKPERRSNSGRGQLGGSSLGGGTNAVVTNLFLERIRNEIRRNYKIPPNIPTDGKLETFIFFKINESGKVYDVRVNDSSGNPAFDDLCVKAIYKSAPLTPPPPELMEQAKTVGFLIPFTNDPS
jgi:colicin import membrane protein